MSIIELNCSGCNVKFNKSKKEYNRQLKKGNTNFYCGLSCSSKYTSKKRITTSIINSNCLFCKTSFVTTTHKHAKKCCSSDCAHKYAQSFVDINKLSNTLKLIYKNNPDKKVANGIRKHPTRLKTLENRNCVVCNNNFQKIWYIKGKTCSNKCFRKLLSINSTNNPNCGGETNYKKVKYKNIWMDSKWEVEIAKLMDSKNIVWERSRKNHMFWWTDLNGVKRRYYPDFYLPKYNLYLDPKNKFKIKQDEYKLNQVVKENHINLVWGLLPYVKQKINNL